jgi:hypothetical protein
MKIKVKDIKKLVVEASGKQIVYGAYLERSLVGVCSAMGDDEAFFHFEDNIDGFDPMHFDVVQLGKSDVKKELNKLREEESHLQDRLLAVQDMLNDFEFAVPTQNRK